MREIKFRAWDKLKGVWFSPTYEAYRGNLEELNIGLSGRLSLRTSDGTADQSTFEGRFEINQYTGLKDRHGVEIYEGDIVQIYQHMSSEKSEVNVVRWDADTCEYKGIYPSIAVWMQHEVIGNIYENPELLKED